MIRINTQTVERVAENETSLNIPSRVTSERSIEKNNASSNSSIEVNHAGKTPAISLSLTSSRLISIKMLLSGRMKCTTHRQGVVNARAPDRESEKENKSLRLTGPIKLKHSEICLTNDACC